MIKSSVLLVLGAMAFTSAANGHHRASEILASEILAPVTSVVTHARLEHAHAKDALLEQAAVEDRERGGSESIAVYYQPLPAPAVAKYAGLGLAHHLTIVYTHRAGLSYAASAGPSDLATPQTPRYTYDAFMAVMNGKPSSYGSLVAYRHNNKPFVKGDAREYYTKDGHGAPYSHTLVMQGANLSAQWASIMRTYAAVDKLHLAYSPLTQNSNSLAGTALRRAGLDLKFSSTSMFAPGTFTQLPVNEGRA